MRVNRMLAPHAICFVAGLLSYLPIGAQTAVPKRQGRLEALTEKERQLGNTTIRLQVFPDYQIIDSLEDALKISIPIVVRIERKETAISPTGDSVYTWYTGRIVENIRNEPMPSQFAVPDAALAPPAVLGLLGPDSFYIRNGGGRITLNGVKINVNETPVSLTVGGTYLLFLRFIPNTAGEATRVATLPTGDAGVVKYDVERDLLDPTEGRHNPTFRRDLLQRSRGRLAGVRGVLLPAPASER